MIAEAGGCTKVNISVVQKRSVATVEKSLLAVVKSNTNIPLSYIH
jgi:hypothetical protein